MLDKTNTLIDQLVVHRVGNKIRSEGMELADRVHPTSKQIELHLLNYFLTPFTSPEVFRFSHPTDLALNEIFTFSKKIFDDPKRLLAESVNSAKHLYECSVHPKIKPGEVYFAYLTGVGFENSRCDALGIFKSETKDLFIKVTEERPKSLAINIEQGANLKTLDKGCIIANTRQKDGYRVFIVDNNNDTTKFWQEKFLDVAPVHNDHFLTEACLTLCKKFGQDVLTATDKQNEEVFFLQKAVEFFSEHDVFDVGEFGKHAFKTKTDMVRFQEYKKQYEDKTGLPQLNTFPISKPSVQKAKRRFKNFIRLDTKIEVKLKFQAADNAEKYVERGYDNKRRMFFYKLFFNKEI